MTSDEVRTQKANVVGEAMIRAAISKDMARVNSLRPMHTELWALQASLTAGSRVTTAAEDSRIAQLFSSAQAIDSEIV